MSHTVQSVLSHAMMELFDSSSTPEIDAEVLLSHCLNQSRAWLLAYQDDAVDDLHVQDYLNLINRRKQGEPIAYILGYREFWSLPFRVTPDTLIPRPETEVLVETVLAIIEKHHKTDKGLQILDLGTGSGAIAIALASELPQTNITAIDFSDEALSIAKLNASDHQLSNIAFLQSHWFSQLEDRQFDIICSNPPYIEAHDPHLQQGDLRFEPPSALASGPDGLFDLRAIIEQSATHLKDNGWIVLEHGFQQSQQTQQLLRENGFVQINTQLDYSGHPRISYAQKG